VLLLLDMCRGEPIPYENLKHSYDGENAGPGHFDRKSVRVLYAHSREQYTFIWRPYA
jgi:hypothetical protein